MKIIISFVLLLAVVSQTANVIASFGGNQITLSVNTPASGTIHDLNFTVTGASTLSVTNAQNLNVLCAAASDANYTLAASPKGFSYQETCSTGPCTAVSTAASANLIPTLSSVVITYTSDTNIQITTATQPVSLAVISTFTTSKLFDEVFATETVANVPLSSDPPSYHVCWSNLDTTMDFGATGSALTVANRYNATISSSSNSLAFIGLAAISAAIVSLI